MKTRVILFLAVSALTTLSFTFVSFNNDKEVKGQKVQVNAISAPMGGFMAEDKI